MPDSAGPKGAPTKVKQFSMITNTMVKRLCLRALVHLVLVRPRTGRLHPGGQKRRIRQASFQMLARLVVTSLRAGPVVFLGLFLLIGWSLTKL